MIQAGNFFARLKFSAALKGLHLLCEDEWDLPRSQVLLHRYWRWQAALKIRLNAKNLSWITAQEEAREPIPHSHTKCIEVHIKEKKYKESSNCEQYNFSLLSLKNGLLK